MVLALMGVLALVLADSSSANLVKVVVIVARVYRVLSVSNSVSCGANLAAVAGTAVPQFLDKVEDEPGG